MITSSVTLESMLAAREKRAARQAALLKRYKKTLVCLTMNIAGETKRSGLIEFAFYEGARRVLRMGEPVFYKLYRKETGPEGYFVFSAEAEAIKRSCVAAEDRDDIGRLFDLDVIDAGGHKLSRGMPRTCLLCQNDAAACARSRAHGLDAVEQKTNAILTSFAAHTHAYAACSALLREVWATPKPGLVDRNNAGAHRDMDLNVFEQSANALVPCFEAFFEIGAAEVGKPYAHAMARLRKRGILAEKEMQLATGGVNTHRGLIYTLGLLLGGRGMALAGGGDFYAHAAALARSDMPEAYRKARNQPGSHGEMAYARYGVKGARGEAESGFLSARRALKKLKHYEAQGFSENDAGVFTLLHTMDEIQDTNLLHRGGMAGLTYARRRARMINLLPEAERIDAVLKLDADFIERNLSPGGSADILAAAYFLLSLERLGSIKAL